MKKKLLMRKHGKTFYWASFFLDHSKIQAIYSIYSFCRIIDDMVDEAKNIAIAKRKLSLLISAWSKNKSHPIINLLNDIPKECWPNKELVQYFLKGQLSDIKFSGMKTESALIIYCYQVAGTVGLMICDVFGIKDKNMRFFAIDLGIAMQLINISRDIREDGLKNRIYIPEKMMKKINTEDLLNPSEKEASDVNKARRKIIKLANTYFDSSKSAVKNLPQGASLAIKLASALYQEIGYKVLKSNYSAQEKRSYVTSISKILITTRIIISHILCKKQKLEAHNPRLHSYIKNFPDAHY